MITTSEKLTLGIATVAIAIGGITRTANAQSGSRNYRTRSVPAQRRYTPPPTVRHQAGNMAEKTMAKKTRLGLEGYCPVCVINLKKWEKGNPRITSTYDGVTYHFPSQSLKALFDKTPEKFVPALNGDCIVCYEKVKKRVPGNIRYAALHNKRLYLFPSEKEKNAFRQNVKAFEKTDLAANGECIVCLAKMGKHVAGQAKHTVIHDGFRYQFPSQREAAAFRKEPMKYTAAIAGMKDKLMKTSQKEMPTSVRVAGRSGCAGCEFGVTPIASPDELGLAIVGNDGRVTVVENAHTQYPEIYAARFEEKQLEVKGTVIKTVGKISWVKPTSLRLLN